jgi:hypothetical protein
MTKAKIALYIALIFLAGAVAGAGIRSMTPEAQTRPRPPRSPEDFANHIFNRIKERLELEPEQIEKIEPVFRSGFDEVRRIQDQSVKEVEAAVKRNHDEIAKLIRPDQRLKLEELDREREKSFRERRGRRHGPGGPPPSAPGPEFRSTVSKEEKPKP